MEGKNAMYKVVNYSVEYPKHLKESLKEQAKLNADGRIEGSFDSRKDAEDLIKSMEIYYTFNHNGVTWEHINRLIVEEEID